MKYSNTNNPLVTEGQRLWKETLYRRDYSRAFALFSEAAEQGYVPAFWEMGNAYREGLGVERDFNEAAAWFERGMQAGDPSCMTFLGLIHFRGEGMAEDEEEAVQLWQEAAEKILSSRLALGPWKAGLLAVGCGFLMTTAVTFARRDKWLPLLFCVPMFIVCGFPHCIADAFYYLTCSVSFWGEHLWNILLLYACLVAGNFAGCNLYRLVMPVEDQV